jgi:hypothetical protein
VFWRDLTVGSWCLGSFIDISFFDISLSRRRQQLRHQVVGTRHGLSRALIAAQNFQEEKKG